MLFFGEGKSLLVFFRNGFGKEKCKLHKRTGCILDASGSFMSLINFRTDLALFITFLPANKPVHQRVAGFDKHTGRSRRLFAEAGDAIVLLFLAVV